MISLMSSFLFVLVCGAAWVGLNVYLYRKFGWYDQYGDPQ